MKRKNFCVLKRFSLLVQRLPNELRAHNSWKEHKNEWKAWNVNSEREREKEN
jgi:hypothetical protein